MALRMFILSALLFGASATVIGCIPAEAPQETAPQETAPTPAAPPPAGEPAAAAEEPAPSPAAEEPAAEAVSAPADVETEEEPVEEVDEANLPGVVPPGTDETIVLPSMGAPAEGKGRLMVSGAAPGQGNIKIGVGPMEDRAEPGLLVHGTLPDGTISGTITKEEAGAQDWNVELNFSFTKPGYEVLSVLPSTMSGEPLGATGVPPESVMLQVTLKLPAQDPNAPEVLNEQQITLDVPAPDTADFFFNVLPAS